MCGWPSVVKSLFLCWLSYAHKVKAQRHRNSKNSFRVTAFCVAWFHGELGNVTIYFYSLLLDILIILSFGVFWELWYHTFPKKDILLITDRWPCYYGPNVQSYQTIYLLVVMFNLLETFFIIMENCTHSFNRVSLSIYFWADCQPESGKQIQRERPPGLQGLPSSTPPWRQVTLIRERLPRPKAVTMDTAVGPGEGRRGWF